MVALYPSSARVRAAVSPAIPPPTTASLGPPEAFAFPLNFHDAAAVAAMAAAPARNLRLVRCPPCPRSARWTGSPSLPDLTFSSRISSTGRPVDSASRCSASSFSSFCKNGVWAMTSLPSLAAESAATRPPDLPRPLARLMTPLEPTPLRPATRGGIRLSHRPVRPPSSQALGSPALLDRLPCRSLWRLRHPAPLQR